MPKKYQHGDYDDDYQEDELGEEYTEPYESDSYGDGDGEEGEEIEDHNLDKGEYESDEKCKVSAAKGRKARVSYDSDDDSESNISHESTGFDLEKYHDPPPAVCTSPASREARMQKLYQEVRACSRTGKVPMKVARLIGFITRDCANFERQVKS